MPWVGPLGWTFSPFGISKGAALEDMRTALGVAPQATVAVGDGSRMISKMLRWAEYGVAMGGASPRVVAAANAQTKPVDEDGLSGGFLNPYTEVVSTMLKRVLILLVSCLFLPTTAASASSDQDNVVVILTGGLTVEPAGRRELSASGTASNQWNRC